MNKSILCLCALLASRIVIATDPTIAVTATPRYPWSGKVDLAFTITGDSDTKYNTSFTAKDLVGGTNLPMKAIYKSDGSSAALTNALNVGSYKWVWDAAADLPSGFVCDRVKVEGSAVAKQGLYMVIDLSSGLTATTYPVIYLDAVPSGGWADEYKTTKLVLRRVEPGTCVVTVASPYYVGVFELTQKQYALITGIEVSYAAGPSGAATPIEHVSYDSVRSVVNGTVSTDCLIGKLRTKTSLVLDLPSEVQWEYSCRAGSTTTYYYGNSANSEYMWFHESQFSSSSTHNVGMLKPNAFGLYDMHGSVAEWCLEMYDSDSHVVRGGHRECQANNCTATARLGSRYWNLGLNHDGFRLVVNIE